MTRWPAGTALVAMLGVAVARAAGADDGAGAVDGDPLEALYALRYGVSTYPESSVLAGGRANVELPFHWVFYALRYRGVWVVIDPGFDDPGLVREYSVAWTDPGALLARILPDAAQVGVVIVTHAHFDHVDRVGAYPEARIIISAEARAAVKRPQAAAFLRASPRVTGFRGSVEVLPGLDVVEVGGHSPGSSVVRVQTRGRTIVLTGDEAYLPDNWKGPRANGSTLDQAANLSFLRSLKAEIDAGGAVAYTFHDPALVPGADPIRRLQ